MLLTVDIGNTNINLGIFDGDGLTMSARISTDRQKTDDQYAVDFVNIFSFCNSLLFRIFFSIIGIIILKNNCKLLAPSINADSSSSFGIDINAWRISNIPKALTAKGSMQKIIAIHNSNENIFLVCIFNIPFYYTKYF